MKVKNGMASSVSFERIPHKRSGIARRSGQSSVMVPAERGASQTPMTKNKSPFAASEKATG
mgnify:CR=1 FL=1